MAINICRQPALVFNKVASFHPFGYDYPKGRGVLIEK